MKAIVVITALVLALAVPSLSVAGDTTITGPQPGPVASAGNRIDVNLATASDLVGVPGIGERLAQAIVELREKKGSFARLEDLLEVRGIGEKSLANLSPYLMVSPQAAAAAAAKR